MEENALYIIGGLFAFIILVNIGSLFSGSSADKEPTQKKSTKKAKTKTEPQTAKQCYGDACKQVKQLEASIKKMQKNATTAQDKKILSNLEGKILNLV